MNSKIHLPCLPEIQLCYNTSQQIIQFSFILNAFVAIFFSLIYGIAADLYGRKPVLLASFFIFIMGTFLVILTPIIHLFILGRFLQALGDTGAAITCGVIMGDYYKGRSYAKIQGITAICVSLSWAASPLIGERIFKMWGWKGNFELIFILSLLVIILLFFWHEQKQPEKTRGTFGTQLLTIKEAVRKVFTFFLCKLSLIQALPLAVFTAFEIILPFIFRDFYGYSVTESALAFFIFIALNIIGSIVYMVLIKFINIKSALRGGTFILLLYFILGLYYFTFNHSSSTPVVYVIFGCLSFAVPFMMISTSTMIVDTYGQHLGVALALLAIIRNIATTFIPWLSYSYFFDSFETLFNICLIPILITFFLLFIIIRK